ncbi:carboxymuconolactone decarboxylase family protein [Paenibacillus sp. FSL R10-2736]|uniref:carboxymuconolactone decarboxylase family protein n=1 Tax=Paenibacillus sp. FSL R10-2736 TaxID=2954692 RepID=UPI0030F9EACD
MSNHNGAFGTQKATDDFMPELDEQNDKFFLRDDYGLRILSPHDRNLINVTANLITDVDIEHLSFHIDCAKQNGLTEEEIVETIIELAFYAGWPRAMSAYKVVKKVIAEEK